MASVWASIRNHFLNHRQCHPHSDRQQNATTNKSYIFWIISNLVRMSIWSLRTSRFLRWASICLISWALMLRLSEEFLCWLPSDWPLIWWPFDLMSLSFSLVGSGVAGVVGGVSWCSLDLLDCGLSWNDFLSLDGVTAFGDYHSERKFRLITRYISTSVHLLVC